MSVEFFVDYLDRFCNTDKVRELIAFNGNELDRISDNGVELFKNFEDKKIKQYKTLDENNVVSVFNDSPSLIKYSGEREEVGTYWVENGFTSKSVLYSKSSDNIVFSTPYLKAIVSLKSKSVFFVFYNNLINKDFENFFSKNEAYWKILEMNLETLNLEDVKSKLELNTNDTKILVRTEDAGKLLSMLGDLFSNY